MLLLWSMSSYTLQLKAHTLKFYKNEICADKKLLNFEISRKLYASKEDHFLNDLIACCSFLLGDVHNA